MRRSNFALRLAPSLMAEARKLADAEGVALNQLINVAVAEKISTLRTAEYFRERAGRADRRETLRILARAGKAHPPQEGDELPAGWKTEGESRETAPRTGALGKEGRNKTGSKRGPNS
jgi:hypothetical protein